MSFNSNVGRQSFTASAGQTDFTFNFKIYDETDIKVYLTPVGNDPDDAADLLTYGSEYTVSIDGDDGGTVTLLSGATLNDTLVFIRDLNKTRDTSYVTNGDLKAATLNLDQDYQTYLIIDGFKSLERVITLPNTDVTMSPELPTVAPGSILMVNPTGTAFEFSTTLSTNINIVTDNIADVNTVASNIGSVQTCNDEIDAIKSVAASGSSAEFGAGIYIGGATVGSDVTIGPNANGLSFAPITITDGSTVTIEDNSTWKII